MRHFAFLVHSMCSVLNVEHLEIYYIIVIELSFSCYIIYVRLLCVVHHVISLCITSFHVLECGKAKKGKFQCVDQDEIKKIYDCEYFQQYRGKSSFNSCNIIKNLTNSLDTLLVWFVNF